MNKVIIIIFNIIMINDIQFTVYTDTPKVKMDQTRAARARSAPPRSSTTDLVIRAISTKFELWRAREILSDVGVQLFTLKITQHEFAL